MPTEFWGMDPPTLGGDGAVGRVAGVPRVRVAAQVGVPRDEGVGDSNVPLALEADLQVVIRQRAPVETSPAGVGAHGGECPRQAA